MKKCIQGLYIRGEGAVSKLTFDTVANGGEKPEYYYLDKTNNPIYDYWMRKPFKGMFVPKLGTPGPDNDMLVFENNRGFKSGWVMPVLPANLKATDNWQKDTETMIKYLEMKYMRADKLTVAYSPSGRNGGWESIFLFNNSNEGVDYGIAFRSGPVEFSTDPLYAFQSQKELDTSTNFKILLPNKMGGNMG
ncbi:hypothetical protein PL321_06295 [Caloramator sp. mosi_1]|uniref:hypothetical protein n=1 Tax=Caloramator sp. mosi_1 TaxID=3023090 RepID=UPI002361498B|nr:hypothetical protein [Caloramator sp. mosi_1]WDC85105.1 hypothetical protein PL321_06295 [Caloramator sp. mosi_1]